MTNLYKAALLASTIGLGCAIPALAQDYYSDTAYEPRESVIVIAPQIRVERYGINAPDKVSLSVSVRYDDLDLRNGEDAAELRGRIRDAAHNVCDQLQDAYRIPQLPETSCYNSTAKAGLIRADAAIRDARYYGGY
jgi:UrcA family protein